MDCLLLLTELTLIQYITAENMECKMRCAVIHHVIAIKQVSEAIDGSVHLSAAHI